MIWTDASKKEQEIKNIGSNHLMMILKHLIRQHIKYWRNQDLVPGYPYKHEILPQEGRLVEEIRSVLISRGKKIPDTFDFQKIPDFVVDGTPDLKFAPLNKMKQFDPQSKKLRDTVALIKKERTPPKPRTRGIIDF